MAITTKEIAQLCNVSQGTVDRALNGRSGINASTREKILEVARQNNYRPHLIASSLSKGKSMSIGVVLFDLKNRYFSQISNTISLAACEEGYFSYVAVTEKNIDSEARLLQNLASRRVDGIIIIPVTRGQDYIRSLKALEVPVVTIGNRLPGITHVAINDYKAAYDSTCYIHQAGYQRICFVCPPLRKKGSQQKRYNITSQEQRARGFRHYVKKNPGLDAGILIQKDYAEAAVSMVRAGGEKIAFFCSSDAFALELLKRFREEGIALPSDAGLMGFDNLDILDYISPRITTVSISIELQGKEAMNTLLKLMSNEPAPDTSFIPHFICQGETL